MRFTILGKGDTAARRSVRTATIESEDEQDSLLALSAVLAGLESLWFAYPPLKRRAIFGCPAGTCGGIYDLRFTIGGKGAGGIGIPEKFGRRGSPSRTGGPALGKLLVDERKRERTEWPLAPGVRARTAQRAIPTMIC